MSDDLGREEGFEFYVKLPPLLLILSCDLRDPKITIVACIRKPLSERACLSGTKGEARVIYMLATVISRHLHRLFASNPMINSHAPPQPLAHRTYTYTYIRRLFNSRAQLMIQIYVARFISAKIEPQRASADLLFLLRTDSPSRRYRSHRNDSRFVAARLRLL